MVLNTSAPPPPLSVFLRSCPSTLLCVEKNIYVCSSHGLFNSNAVAILEESPVDTVFVTNSVPLPEGCKSKKIEQVPFTLLSLLLLLMLILAGVDCMYWQHQRWVIAGYDLEQIGAWCAPPACQGEAVAGSL